MTLKLTGEAGVYYDDWRECHNPACGAHFKPDTPSRFHCSEACAAECLVRRDYGMKKVEAKPIEPLVDDEEGDKS